MPSASVTTTLLRSGPKLTDTPATGRWFSSSTRTAGPGSMVVPTVAVNSVSPCATSSVGLPAGEPGVGASGSAPGAVLSEHALSAPASPTAMSAEYRIIFFMSRWVHGPHLDAPRAPTVVNAHVPRFYRSVAARSLHVLWRKRLPKRLNAPRSSRSLPYVGPAGILNAVSLRGLNDAIRHYRPAPAVACG